MTTVLVEPGNAHDFSDEFLEELGSELASEQLTVEIVSRPQRGYQVTFWQVVYIYVLGEGGKAVLGFAYNTLIERVVSKAKKVFRERKSKEGRPSSGRPLYIGVLDKEGEVVKSVLIDRDGNESDITEEDRARSSKRPPPKPYDQADEADS